MTKSLFADLTVIKVLADAALVSDTYDRMNTTSIAFNIAVSIQLGIK